MQRQEWYKNTIFYEINLRAFMDGNNDGIGDLLGLISKLDYLQQLGVDCLWLMPIYPSPRKDSGYDISDYCSIDSVYGSVDIFHRLIEETHKRHMRIVMDLVVNHTSDQHPWFQSARQSPKSPYRDYYVWSDSEDLYKDARIIFLDTEKSNWAWDDKAQQYYWHRFYSSQPDLNYRNPAVRKEMLNIIRFWSEFGIDGFRVDAVPYLFEEDGTNCENLPETHAYLKTIRKYIERNFPGTVLICEANQPPIDVIEYLGNGDEFHLAFHFPLMPKIFLALRKADKYPLEEVIKTTPILPNNCQWGTFLRNHDELTLEMVTDEERDWMWQEYAPDPLMRLNLGIRRRLAPLLDNNTNKIMLAYNLLFSLPGSPFIYYGDEIGMGDNISLPDREGVRTPMQWDLSINAGFSTNESLATPVISSPLYSKTKVNVQNNIDNPSSIWRRLQNLIKIRKSEIVFDANNIELMQSNDDRVLAFTRKNREEEVLFIHNLCDKVVKYSHQLFQTEECYFIDLISNKTIKTREGYLQISLQPFQSMFMKKS